MLSQTHQTYSYIPHFLIFHFLLAHVFTATRALKGYLKLDHNVNPREDIARFGEASVKSGKITARQLKLLKRNDACHQHLIENYPAIVAALVFAAATDVDRAWVNKMCWILTADKLIYTAAYLGIERGRIALIRSVAWWVGNGCCAMLVWAAGKKFNQGAF